MKHYAIEAWDEAGHSHVQLFHNAQEAHDFLYGWLFPGWVATVIQGNFRREGLAIICHGPHYPQYTVQADEAGLNIVV